MKKLIVIMTTLGTLLSCSNTSNVPNYLGDPNTRGFCGKAGKEFNNPITNNIDEEHFEILPNAEPGEYKAAHATIYYRESEADLESPQVMAVHSDVFLGDEFITRTFAKNCGRGFERNSTGFQEVVLPIKLTLNADKTWKTQTAAKYTIEYNPGLNTGLNLKAELDESANPSSDDRDYVEALIIKRVDKDKEKLMVVKTYEEFKEEFIKSYFLSVLDVADQLNVEKQYQDYLAKVEKLSAKNQSAVKAPAEMFLQIEVQSNPKVYARIQIRRIEEAPATE